VEKRPNQKHRLGHLLAYLRSPAFGPPPGPVPGSLASATATRAAILGSSGGRLPFQNHQTLPPTATRRLHRRARRRRWAAGSLTALPAVAAGRQPAARLGRLAAAGGRLLGSGTLPRWESSRQELAWSIGVCEL